MAVLGFNDVDSPVRIPLSDNRNCALLIAKLDRKRMIRLNNQRMGPLDRGVLLTERLDEIFRSREEKRVFEPMTRNTYKTVAISADEGLSYGDVIRLVDLVAAAGPRKIVILFPHLVDK